MGLLVLVVALAAMVIGGVIQATHWGDGVGSALLLAGFALFVGWRVSAWRPEKDASQQNE